MKKTGVFIVLFGFLTALTGCAGEQSVASAQVPAASAVHVAEPTVSEGKIGTDAAQMRPFTSRILSEAADLNHDGVPEQLEFRTFPMDPAGPPVCMVYELRVLNAEDAAVWSEQATDVHPGWNALFLCRIDGKDYLLRYHPTMYQGWCTYSYQIFSFDGEWSEALYKEDALDFDINFHQNGHSYDPTAIAAFIETVNGYLKDSTVLLNTDEALEFAEGEPVRDRVWFLNCDPDVAYDQQASLEENLLAFAAYQMAATA